MYYTHALSNDITFTCVHTPYKHSCLTHLTSQRCMASCRGPGSVCQSMGNVLWLNPWPPSLAVIHVRPSLVASVCSFSSTSQYREAAANQPLTEHDAAVFWQNAKMETLFMPLHNQETPTMYLFRLDKCRSL